MPYMSYYMKTKKDTKNPFTAGISRLSIINGDKREKFVKQLKGDILKATFLSSEQKGALLIRIDRHT